MNLSLLDEHQAISLNLVLSQPTKSIVYCKNENKNNLLMVINIVYKFFIFGTINFLKKLDAHNMYKENQSNSINKYMYGLIDYNHMHLRLQESCKQMKIRIKTTT